MEITMNFHCEKLSGTLSYATCLKRQAAVTGLKTKEPVYPECTLQCEQGAKIRAMLPTHAVKMKKKVKNISLRPNNGQRKKNPIERAVSNSKRLAGESLHKAKASRRESSPRGKVFPQHDDQSSTPMVSGSMGSIYTILNCS